MGINFDDLKKKAQEELAKHSETMVHGLDKAGGFAKSKLGKHADKIDSVTGKAKEFLDKQSGKGGSGGSTGSGGSEGPTGSSGPDQPRPPH